MPGVKIPKLSIILIIHRMANQADNTLFSLSAQFQRNVGEDDYELIAIENSSDDVLGATRATAHGKNIRYYYREETSDSPVGAINFGFTQCRAPYIGLMIDGARIASPRIVEYALAAKRMWEHPFVVVPGYHLGDTEHHYHVTGEIEKNEQRMLQAIDWKKNGYDLFTISCLSGANYKGPLGPFLESNCIFCSRDGFDRIGRADSRFNLPGGGSVNIHMYHALARIPQNKLVVLAGEGTFHQFHGGVTTSEVSDRDEVIESHRKHLREINGGQFKGVHREPLVLGVIPHQATQHLKSSANLAERSFKICQKLVQPLWPGEPVDVPKPVIPSVSKPSISIVIFGSERISDLKNTLHSLSPNYQRNVESVDYEVVVIQRNCRNDLKQHDKARCDKHVRFEVYNGTDQSFDSLIRFVLAHAHAPLVCPITDGTPIVTPRLIEHVLYAQQMFAQPLVVVPTYRYRDARLPVLLNSWNIARRKLRRIEWEKDGYELFTHACFNALRRDTTRNPLLISPYYFFPRTELERILHSSNQFNWCQEENASPGTPHSGCSSISVDETNRVLLAGEGAFPQSEAIDEGAWRSWFGPSRLGARGSRHRTMIDRAIAENAKEMTILGTLPGQWYRLLSQLPTLEPLMGETSVKAA